MVQSEIPGRDREGRASEVAMGRDPDLVQALGQDQCPEPCPSASAASVQAAIAKVGGDCPCSYEVITL
jgi:hypothetical protein